MTRVGEVRDRLWVAAIAALAVALRVWQPFGRIFRGDYVNFQGDAVYRMRVVDNLIANFPHRLTVDPYAISGGQFVGVAPLFDYLVATLALIVGLGHPSTVTVERVAAFVPVALSVVCVLLMWTIATRVGDRRVGLAAAAVLAVIPGHFFDRTVLGATDHHALESVLALSTLLWAVIALSPAPPDAKTRMRTAAQWLAGVSLGAYFLTWTSAPFLLAIFGIWLAVQWLTDLLADLDASIMTGFAVRLSAPALAMVLLFQNPGMGRYMLQVGGLFAFLMAASLAHAASLAVAGKRLRGSSAVVALLVIVVSSVAAVWLARPAAIGAVLDELNRLTGMSTQLVREAQPLLNLGGRFSWWHPWTVFGAAFYFGIIGMALFVSRLLRRQPADLLVWVWALVTLLATLGQNRFGYYLSPMLALFTAWASVLLIDRLSRGKRVRGLQLAVAAVVATAVLYQPYQVQVLMPTRDEGMPQPWFRALAWLKQSTPKPFGADLYASRYDATTAQPSYTVMNWWDYGYWVMRTARRVPMANPTQNRADEAASFYLATNELFANTWLLHRQSKYVLVDQELVLLPTADPARVVGKLRAMPKLVGRRPEEFAEPMYERLSNGALRPRWVFYPDYYRTMAVHLYFYGAAAYTPSQSTWVVTYVTRRASNGDLYKEISKSSRFATYDKAAAYLQSLGPGQHVIVGFDAGRSPVPLPALSNLRLIHDEAALVGTLPAVRIFERHP